jgi:hypothetical protein
LAECSLSYALMAWFGVFFLLCVKVFVDALHLRAKVSFLSQNTLAHRRKERKGGRKGRTGKVRKGM